MRFSVLFSSVLAKKFIVNVNNLQTFVQNIQGDFFYTNILDTINIGDSNFVIVESEMSPLYLLNYDSVDHIEEDLQVNINNQQSFLIKPDFNIDKAYYLQNDPVWGLDRIDQKSNELNKKYYYPTSRGSDVDVYIVDTGIDISHSEFENRAIWGKNFVDSKNTDCNGHGTHVAGTIGSKTYGVAKKTTLFAVKVLNCEGSGSFSGILRGLEYVVSSKNKRNKASVINMSLGGKKSSSINKAILELYKAGITSIVAAGNENENACDSSPASAPEAITVGATTKENTFAGFSNWGTCVNILSPGVNILSTWYNNSTKNLSGTSMASPHVAGVAALILSENKELTPNALKKLLTDTCTLNTIKGVEKTTKNCFLYSIF